MHSVLVLSVEVRCKKNRRKADDKTLDMQGACLSASHMLVHYEPFQKETKLALCLFKKEADLVQLTEICKSMDWAARSCLNMTFFQESFSIHNM